MGIASSQEGRHTQLPQVQVPNHCQRYVQAEESLSRDPNLNHEYLPIAGLPDFTSAAQQLIFGSTSAAIKEKRVSEISCL